MSLHAIKEVLELVPEASGFIKRAYVEEEFPTKDKDSTIASALEIAYLTKVAHQPVDSDDQIRVLKAVRLYGASEEVSRMTDSLVKSAQIRQREAQSTEQELRIAETILESECAGLPNIEKIASRAANLYDNYGSEIKSDLVRLYAGAGKLNKEAALLALDHRASVTEDKGFTKLASIISATNPESLTIEENRALASAIINLEKRSGFVGDIYKDAFWFTKEAIDKSILVNLGSKTVPAITLQGIPQETVKEMIGEDVASLLAGDLMNLKRGVEALPLPEKQLIARLCKC